VKAQGSFSMLMVSMMLAVACSDGSAGDGGDAPDGGGRPPQIRSERELCKLEVARLAACDAITPADAAATTAECDAPQFSDGQVAYFTSCIKRWACGGEAPACLGEPVTGECADDDDCRSGETCTADGLCECIDAARVDAGGRRCVDPSAPVVHQGDVCHQDGYTCGSDDFYCLVSSLTPGDPGRCLQSCSATGACPGSLRCCDLPTRNLFVCDVSC